MVKLQQAKYFFKKSPDHVRVTDHVRLEKLKLQSMAHVSFLFLNVISALEGTR